MILIYSLLALLVLLIIAFFAFVIFKRKGKTKIGLLILLSVILFVTYCVFINNFDELLISKSDVKSDLKNAKISLNGDFEILENSVVGFPERYQKTKLKISQKDFSQIINEIRNAKDFKISNESMILYQQSIDNESPGNKTIISNYSFNDRFIREGLLQKEDYVPIYIIASFDPVSTTLEYERIED